MYQVIIDGDRNMWTIEDGRVVCRGCGGHGTVPGSCGGYVEIGNVCSECGEVHDREIVCPDCKGKGRPSKRELARLLKLPRKTLQQLYGS